MSATMISQFPTEEIRGPGNANTYNGDQVAEAPVGTVDQRQDEAAIVADESNGSDMVDENKPINSIYNGLVCKRTVLGTYSINGEKLLTVYEHTADVSIHYKDKGKDDNYLAALAAACMRVIRLRNVEMADHYAARIDEGISALEMLIEQSDNVF